MDDMKPGAWAGAYHIVFAAPAEGHVLSQRDIDDDARLLSLLERFAESVQSPAKQVTGSLFMKRYSLCIAGILYGFMRSRETIDLSAERVKLVWKDTVLQLAMESPEQPACLNGIQQDRERRTRYLKHVFADQVNPMIRRVAEVTRIAEETLWATLSYSLAYWKKAWLQDKDLTERGRLRMEEDFAAMYEEWDEHRLPNYPSSPLTAGFRSVANPWDPDKPILLRSKCCLFYCLPGKNDAHCYTCPKITDDKRLNKYAAAHGHKLEPGEAKAIK